MITNSTTMAVLESCPKHNMVAYLEKTEGNAKFHEKRYPTEREVPDFKRPSETTTTPFPPHPIASGGINAKSDHKQYKTIQSNIKPMKLNTEVKINKAQKKAKSITTHHKEAWMRDETEQMTNRCGKGQEKKRNRTEGDFEEEIPKVSTTQKKISTLGTYEGNSSDPNLKKKGLLQQLQQLSLQCFGDDETIAQVLLIHEPSESCFKRKGERKEYDYNSSKNEADRLLALRLQDEEEREQFTVEERAKFLYDTIASSPEEFLQEQEEPIGNQNQTPYKNHIYRNQ
ncbi:hypothetical protein Tco_0772932 [Tanacetum coccineum]|uniref:Uncharacterized protein n=1 Tax=Tanacetum coccineum TaxID=301880 RepID=A0ABQ4ZLG6_9ASTR